MVQMSNGHLPTALIHEPQDAVLNLLEPIAKILQLLGNILTYPFIAIFPSRIQQLKSITEAGILKEKPF